MRLPAYCFSPHGYTSGLEDEFQETFTDYIGKPFYYGAGLVIDFYGGLIRLLVEDAKSNPGNAERLVINDLYSGWITPYNPIMSMADIPDRGSAGALLSKALVHSLGMTDSRSDLLNLLREAISTVFDKVSDGQVNTSLIEFGNNLIAYCENQGRGELASRLNALFVPLSKTPMRQVLQKGLSFISPATVIGKKLIYGLDAAPKNLNQTVMPTAAMARCQPDNRTAGFLASALLLDFYLRLMNMNKNEPKRYPPLTLMVNGVDYIKGVPWAEVVSGLAQKGCKGFLFSHNAPANEMQSLLGEDIVTIYSALPEKLKEGRGYSPFPNEKWSYSLDEIA